MRGLDRYKKVLQSYASELTNEVPAPLNLVDLCQRMGVRVRRDNDRDKPVLVDSEAGPIILLPGKHKDVDDGFEKFLIAHELGHLLLHRDCGASPLGRSEYWKHETLCDWFARQLLLPDAIVVPLLSRVLETANQYLNFSTALTRKYGVNWRTAAARISDLRPVSAFFAITPQPDGRSRVIYSTAPRREAEKRFLPRQARLSDLAHNHRVRKSVALREDEISCLPCPARVDSAVAMWHATELRVAVIASQLSLSTSLDAAQQANAADA